MFLQKSIIYLLCVVVFISLSFMSYVNLDIEYLGYTSGDELYQFHQILNMFRGFKELSLEKIFRYEFYNYGFLFYIFNLLLSLPFIISNNTELIIYAPRVGVAISAILLLIVVYKFARLFLNRIYSNVIVLCVVLMPGFWSGATLYKPDMMMSLFVAISIFFYAKDNFRYAKNYSLGVIFFGLAIAIKFQAVILYPFALFYASAFQIKSFLSTFRIVEFFIGLRRVLCSLILPLIIWVVCNPYILHKRGFGAWMSQFTLNMNSNITNHGSNVEVSLMQKIALIDNFYIPYIVLFILLLCIVYLLFLLFKRDLDINVKEDSNYLIFSCISFYFVISSLYMFFKVNKLWVNYYLGIIVGGVYLLVYLLFICRKNKLFIRTLSILLLVYFAFSHSSVYNFHKKADLTNAHMYSEEILSTIKDNFNDDLERNKRLNIATINPNFEYQKLGLSYSNIFPIIQFSDQVYSLHAFMTKSNSKNPAFFTKKDILILPIEWLLKLQRDSNVAIQLKRDFSKNILKRYLDIRSAEELVEIEKLDQALAGFQSLLLSSEYEIFAISKNYIFFRNIK